MSEGGGYFQQSVDKPCASTDGPAGCLQHDAVSVHAKPAAEPAFVDPRCLRFERQSAIEIPLALHGAAGLPWILLRH